MVLRERYRWRSTVVGEDLSDALFSCVLLQPNPPFRLLEDMRENDTAPDVISYSAAITACGKGGKWEEALRYGP